MISGGSRFNAPAPASGAGIPGFGPGDTIAGFVNAARSGFRVLAALTKFRIAALASFSAATGYCVARRATDSGSAAASLGVLLLAMGACALNEVQDGRLDARMARTRSRPIPSGRVKPLAALAVSCALLAGGFVVLRGMPGPAALIGLAAVGWYNGVYTYMKRVTGAAVLPGALIGALPPLIGWAAAGGDPLGPRALALAFFFFVWQVPHFWLLLMAFEADYDRAGLPSLARQFGPARLRRLVFVWMSATAAVALLLPIYLLVSSPWLASGLVACSVWIALIAGRLGRRPAGVRGLFQAFRAINLYALMIMALLIADALI